MSGRIVIPIRNLRGQLVAYAGRALDGAPNYKLPAGFRKGLEVFNFERAAVTVPRITPPCVIPSESVGDIVTGARTRCGGCLFRRLRHPEIQQLHDPIGRHVGGLEIAMHDSFLVRRFQSRRDLPRECNAVSSCTGPRRSSPSTNSITMAPARYPRWPRHAGDSAPPIT